MKKVLRLVSVQIWAMLGSMFAIGEYNKKKTKALYTGFAFFVIIFSIISFFYAYTIGSALKAYNSIETLPSLFMAITSIAVLITTIYKVKGTIFGFKDYDMVMSMPVSNSKIVASRLILLYAINLVFVLIIMIPMTVAYGILVGSGFLFYTYNILMVFFIPLVPIIMASLIGTILTYISMRLKYSNTLYIVFVFLMLLMWVIMPFFLQGSEDALVEINRAISESINRIYPLAALYTKAVIQLNLLSMITFMLASLLAFLLFSLAVGKAFVKINSTIMTGRYRADYKLRELKNSSPLMALYRKEIKRYFASTSYVMNTGFGMVILLIFAIALPFIDLDALVGEMQIKGTLQDFLPVIISFCIATSCTTMASVSIEGKNLWIIKSLPVSAAKIFASKILVNLTILAPAVFASLLMGITMQLPFINGLLLVLTAVSFSIFISIYGLVINLSFPNLSWSNETVVVKQSTATMISTFSGLGFTAVLYLLLMLIGNFNLSLLIFICFMWIAIFILYKRLMAKGKGQFERL